jgi:hypothetical protein
MVYLPLEFDGAEVIQNVSPNDFPDAAFERFGVRFKAPPLRYSET